LFQEVFLRVHRNAHSFRENCRFKTWLFQLATHAAIDQWRARQRRPVLLSFHDPAAGSAADTASADVPDPADAAAQSELRDEVRAAVASLPDRQRAALVLTYFEGFTGREAAEVLKCSESSVKTHLSRALQALAQHLPNPDESTNEARSSTP
jgi:RNA polymerase sigma-70 factor, ECF subfamily